MSVQLTNHHWTTALSWKSTRRYIRMQHLGNFVAHAQDNKSALHKLSYRQVNCKQRNRAGCLFKPCCCYECILIHPYAFGKWRELSGVSADALVNVHSLCACDECENCPKPIYYIYSCMFIIAAWTVFWQSIIYAYSL